MPDALTSGSRLLPQRASLLVGPHREKRRAPAYPAQVWPTPGATLDLDFINNRAFVLGRGQASIAQATGFTRASSGTYWGADGLLKTATNDEPRICYGALPSEYRKQHLSESEDLTNATYWTPTNCTTSVAAIAAPTSVPMVVSQLTATAVSGGHSVANLAIANFDVGPQGMYAVADGYFKANTSSRFIFSSHFAYSSPTFDLATGISSPGGFYGGYNQSVMVDVGGGWFYCASITYRPQGTIYVVPTVVLLNAAGAGSFVGSGESIYCTGLMVWRTENPYDLTAGRSQYQPARAKAIANTHPVAVNNDVSWLFEESRVNRLLWCRDLTNAAWMKTNITPTLDQAGIDGAANSATRLTATAPNGTCTQAVTLSANYRVASAYIKRITGSWVVYVTYDGSTWLPVALPASGWHRAIVADYKPPANPVIGIKLEMSGDEIAVDYAQLEDGTYPTSPILTTSATVTRAQDMATVPADPWYDSQRGAFAFHGSLMQGQRGVFGTTDSTTTYGIVFASGGYIGGTAHKPSGWFQSHMNGNNLYSGSVSAIGDAPDRWTRQAICYSNDRLQAFGIGSSENLRPYGYEGNTPFSQSPRKTALQVGRCSSISMNGYMKRVVYWPGTVPPSSLATWCVS